MLKKLFKKYFTDALSHMAMGLFCSLILGLIIGQIAKIPGMDFLNFIAEALSADSPLTGAAIGAAIAYGMGCAPLVILSSVVSGAVGYGFGGPVGAYLAVIIGEEAGMLVSRKTPVDIILTPLVTILAGCLFAKYCCSPINDFMLYLGSVINKATALNPFLMGVTVSVLVGCALTLPISSVAICVMLGIDGLAAGAATAGCCAQMIGFAVISYKDNGVGMGTSGLVGPLAAFASFCNYEGGWRRRGSACNQDHLPVFRRSGSDRASYPLGNEEDRLGEGRRHETAAISILAAYVEHKPPGSSFKKKKNVKKREKSAVVLPKDNSFFFCVP